MHMTPFGQPLAETAARAWRAGYERVWASDLFDSARSAARRYRLWSAFSGRSSRLRVLADAQKGYVVSGAHAGGTRTVPIEQIRGSEAGHVDFDGEFRPLDRRVRGRWLSLAMALAEGAALPPVELIQLGDDYFVRDGHHRISVARAMGQELIDATVIVLEGSARRKNEEEPWLAPPMEKVACSTRCSAI